MTLIVNSFKVLLFSLLFATSAIAQDAPDIAFLDKHTLDRINEDHYIVEYWNSEFRNSTPIVLELEYGSMTVIVAVSNTAGPETLAVTVPAGWIALPQSITVDDGSMGHIDIVRISTLLTS